MEPAVSRFPHLVKKLRWILALLALAAVARLVSQVFCPHPEHWLGSFLDATHLKRYEPPPDFTSDSLRPTEPADYTLYEPPVCEVHAVEMRTEVVPVHYGVPVWAVRTKDGQTLEPADAPPHALREQQFPHAAHFAMGGCVHSIDSATTARIRVCSNCERAEQKWYDEHPAEK